MSAMNEKVEEPQEQAADCAPMPDEELQKILEAHRMWVESEGKDGERADLCGANLQGAELDRADFQGAILENADLRDAHLEEAKLHSANLSGINLQRAELKRANFEAANLHGANLQEAKLVGTTLREAHLQDADLTDAKGLLAGQLAGANVSGAKLPQDIHKFEALTTVEEASKNTRKIFLAMLLGCAYSVLTIFSTTDARLLTNSASSPLPIIRTPIPIAGFFGVAPAILLAIYLYFHFYLQRLWERLAKLPAVFPDGNALDEKAYPWLLNALVRSHFALLKKDRPPLSRLQAVVSILLAWWAVPFTIALFWLRSLQRHDWVLTGFLVAFLVLAIVCAAWFQRLAKLTLRGKLPVPVRFKENWRRMEPYKEIVKRNYKFAVIGMAVLPFAFAISYGAINGIGKTWWKVVEVETSGPEPRGPVVQLRKIIPWVLPYVGARAFADLVEQDVSTKPPNWFTGNKELTEIVSGAQLKGMDLRHASADRAFLVKADLRGADLQGANLRGAKLQEAKLRGAKLQEANLLGANLQEADLLWANLQRAKLDDANLQGADLYDANLQEADLGNLGRANLQGANLRAARGLTASQVKKAKNWELAFYDEDFLKRLGLPPNHNKIVKKKLAELEKKKKGTGAK